MTPLLYLEHISASIQNQRILNDISLTVNKDQHWAIIGKSGSGKSALLKAIAGKQSISGGAINYYFQPSENHNPAETITSQHIALIESRHHFKNFSNTADFYYQQRFNSSDSEDALTVEQYLAAIELKAAPHHYWTLERVIDRLNLKSLFDKEIIKLSNGETKRLRIASALIKSPSVLLLDQPLTGLDVNSRQHFGNLLQEIADSGITIIMATSPYEIPSVINNIVVIENGSIENTFSAKGFDPKTLNWIHQVQIDENEITALLNQSAGESFQQIITMRNVHVQYSDVVILNNINWQVKQGDRWALLGANGAGKSTLLSLAYGDNPQAYANDITLFDRKRGSGESIWDIKKRCGFVSPELYQYFPLDNNCLQVIESGFYDTLGLFRMSDPKRAGLALRWMRVLGIHQYAHKLLKNIPASAQRLCLLARALVKNPTLLILDEPCQGMDDQQQQKFKQVIDTICQESNITLIYVTHYQHEIPNAVNKYIRLTKGEPAIIEG
ncbi:ATP-binding cassette domain-containing protein [Mucilaginibacter sp. KACC 22063]|uniref:ATP-binding cassette domain-containing protein n=1 Tax=Mucilaginibacter sp. KACC 22063 TaxID=3025666 RepID=UPI002366C8C4|nr:ATP-binding cassette domain-containing protein [Mucilaginibacter sp. KACC 22063]WDF56983.1 ATP-binding cassette domain-containing protein [Mucilaginibacter sp. KACC 22063]